MSELRSQQYAPFALAFAIWACGATLYLIGFFQRVAPAVMTDELMTEFALSAAALGNLSAVYFYSYVAMQIPTGVLVDHYGPRRVLTIGAGVAAVGTLLFAMAPNYALVAAGRLMVGASVGVAFVSMLKLAAHWLHPTRFAAMAGLALVFGVVGAVLAGAPLRLAVDGFGWRPVMVVSGAVAAVLAVLTWVIVRDDPRDRGYRSYVPERSAGAPRHSMLGGVRAVLRTRNVLLIFFINGGISAPALTFAGLWGVPYLTTQYGLATPVAAVITSAVLMAWAVGGPLVGTLSDRMRERKPLYLTGAIIAAAGWFIVFLSPRLSVTLLATTLIVTGIASAVVMVGFAYAKESAPGSLAGSTSGVINMGNMLGGMIMQPAVGWMLDRSWDGTLSATGARVYGFEAYRAGFSLMLVWIAIAVLLAALTKETHCRQQPG